MNIGSMTAYRGQGFNGDSISGGGRYVQENGYGHEIYNFLPSRGNYYGYGRPANDAIALKRLGAPEGSLYLDHVLVVWVAKSHVVGWYKEARLYREWQPAPAGSKRNFGKEECGFYAEAKASNCVLLHPDARKTLAVPRARDVVGGMGRYVWYAEGPQHKPFLKELFKLVDSDGNVKQMLPKRKGGGRGWMNDPSERKRIEEAAIREVGRYYAGIGYAVRDRQKHCVGWDLEADLNGTSLLLEVKGTSSTIVNVELTSNEFSEMKKNRRKGYRICIVADALGRKPVLSIYSFVSETKQWEHHETGAALVVEPVFVEIARLHA